jgi:NAD(P)-dependent dehydrogenase (short-subunit alcohol dehydrogenase family)
MFLARFPRMFQFANALRNYGSEFLIIICILPIIGLLAVIISWQYTILLDPKKLAKRVGGKHCLVTGGSLGLGSKIAEQLLLAGAHVTIVSRGKKDSSGTSCLERTCQDLKNLIVNDTQIVDYIPCDLSDYAQVYQMAQELQQKGHLPDFVVCNAGSSISGFLSTQIPKPKSKSEFEQGNHEWMITQNYYSAVFVIRALMQVTRTIDTNPQSASISGISPPQAALLPKQIVIVGSVLSLLSFIGYSAYSAR